MRNEIMVKIARLLIEIDKLNAEIALLKRELREMVSEMSN